ncbi:hypothetical protein ACJMK2_039746 [Sinanodonta woodiana]|uniref:Palmitoyltransferase n=1 Tax=Sinanodonta woodiana TaxID=1069815 RepID=A0ABD3WGC1_SINWO
MLKYLPKTRTDIFAFAFTLCGIHAVMMLELFFVLPWIVDQYQPYSSLKYYFHISAAIFLYINTIGNLWKTIVTDTSNGSIVLPSILKPGWKFCSACEANSPPRSYHCGICKRCVLKRDHHCNFTGNCIGFRNYRYYMLLMLHSWLASVYANVMNLGFIWMTIGEDIWSLHKLIFPFFAWVMRSIDIFTMIKSFVLMICLGVSCLLTALLGYHIGNVWRGQTTYERSHNIKQYNLGWKENLKGVFGEKWYLTFFSPFIKSELPGDGIDFVTSAKYENPKDM